MSLIRQLWIAVALMMTIAFISSFSISTLKAKDYFEEQLLLKNIDNANSLALTLSQIEKDPVMIELMIAAQFDTGHYQRIELIDPEGKTIQRRVFDGDASLGIPNWFTDFAPLNIEPGVAQVQDGWFQLGTLFVESHTRFAYQALWATTRDLFVWFLVVSLGAGILGTLILKYITQPLDDVVNQAEAIGGRRFITSKEPKTLEFGRVVRAMNILSDRVRAMLNSERERLEELRFKNQHDSLTGLANREYFFSQLDTYLGDNTDSQHAIALVRLSHLAKLNMELGHAKTDTLLCMVATRLRSAIKELSPHASFTEIGRLNGSDFAVLCTDQSDIELMAHRLLQKLSLINEVESYHNVEIPVAVTHFCSNLTRAELMMQLDDLLARAEQKEMTSAEVRHQDIMSMRFKTAEEWKNVMDESVRMQKISAQLYPVVDINRKLIHHEAMMRLELSGQVHNAGYFIPWARRLNMMPQLDLHLLIHELRELDAQPHSVAINLSNETLSDVVTMSQLIEQLKAHPNLAQHLWFEVSERCVVHHTEVFMNFCHSVKPLGCYIGIEKAGTEFAKIQKLEEIGLDYIKLDPAFIVDLQINAVSQSFIRGLSTLAHSIGLLVIAEGIRDAQIIELLEELGVDAFSGPAISEPAKEI